MNPTDSKIIEGLRIAVRRRRNAWWVLVRIEYNEVYQLWGAWLNPRVWTEMPLAFPSMSAAWAFLNRAGVKA